MTCDTETGIAGPTTLTLGENTDPQVTITVTNRGRVVNLTGKELQFIAKASADIADGSALFTLDSSGGSPTIQITTPAAGIAVADFTGKLTGTGIPGTLFYKLLIIDNITHKRDVVAYGPLVVTNL